MWMVTSAPQGVWSALTFPHAWPQGSHFIRSLSYERYLSTLCCVVWSTIPDFLGLRGFSGHRMFSLGKAPGKRELSQLSCLRPVMTWNLMAVLPVRGGDLGACLPEGKISVKRQSVSLHWIWAAGQPWIVGNSRSPHTERAPHPNSSCSLQFPTISSLCVHRMCWTGCGYISYKEP